MVGHHEATAFVPTAPEQCSTCIASLLDHSRLTKKCLNNPACVTKATKSRFSRAALGIGRCRLKCAHLVPEWYVKWPYSAKWQAVVAKENQIFSSQAPTKKDVGLDTLASVVVAGKLDRSRLGNYFL